MNINKFFLAGLIATIPMTLVMSKMFKELPRKDKYPLPPRIISMHLAEDLGFKNKLNEKEKLSFTLLNHFAYGAFAASLYFPLTQKYKISNQISGIVYGVTVWGLSYLGLLPALKLYPKITKEPADRNFLMIISHVVWGSSLGLIKTITEIVNRKRAFQVYQ